MTLDEVVATLTASPTDRSAASFLEAAVRSIVGSTRGRASPQDVADVEQDLLFLVWQRLQRPGFPTEERPIRAWIRTAAERRFIDLHRAAKRFQGDAPEEDGPSPIERLADPLAEHPQPGEEAHDLSRKTLVAVHEHVAARVRESRSKQHRDGWDKTHAEAMALIYGGVPLIEQLRAKGELAPGIEAADEKCVLDRAYKSHQRYREALGAKSLELVESGDLPPLLGARVIAAHLVETLFSCQVQGGVFVSPRRPE